MHQGRQRVICAYLKAVRNIQLRRGDTHEIVHQNHDHDGYKYSKVADSGTHLNTQKQNPNATLFYIY